MNKVRENDIQDIIKRFPYKELEGKKILITGANGFIARYIVDTIMFLNKYYFKEKSQLFVLCRNSEKMESVFRDYLEDPNFYPVIQSVEEKINLDIAVDYILHAAGSSSSKIQKESPVSILKSNVIGTYNLLEYAKDKSLSSFLFFSSGAVYGSIPCDVDCVCEDDYYNVDFMQTDNCYIEGKRMAEQLCFSYEKEFNVPAKSIRISHTYGPGIDLNDGHVYSDFVKNICKKEDLLIKGTGSATRAFCYITDTVVAIFLVLLKGKNGEAYNMANNQNIFGIKELAQILVNEAFLERKLSIEYTMSQNEKQEIKIKIDTKKLEEWGWYPVVSVTEGFRRTVQSFEGEE